MTKYFVSLLYISWLSIVNLFVQFSPTLANKNLLPIEALERSFNEFDRDFKNLRKQMSSSSNLLEQMHFEQPAYKAYATQGKLSLAMYYKKRLPDFTISHRTKSQDKQIANLQVQYQMRSKGKDITFKTKHISLFVPQNNLQKTALSYQGILRNLLFAGATLLVLLLGLSYNSYQMKRKADAEIEEQKEEIDTQNESLRQLLSEREWLLREIQHRVKNNLQIVISLLNSQLFTIKDAAAKDALRESQQRMHAISMIHQRLYQNDEVSRINIADYVRDLTNYLHGGFGEPDKIHFNLDIEPLLLDVAQAVPLGLILNEAVTNSIKYTDSRRQTIVGISLKQIGQQIAIEIVDNGKGLPADFEPTKTKSLGMKLITGLTKQLKGSIKFSNDTGLRISILIPVKAPFSEE